MALSIALALLAQAAADPGPTTIADMVALYDAACLRAFPDDAALDRLMTARKATALTPEQVRVTLHDDPGRGWVVRGKGKPVMVMLELPPFHACSVRALVGEGPHDLSALRTVTDAYKRTHPGFTAEPVFEGERGGIRIRAENETRRLPDGGAEALMVIDQRVTDPARLGPGQTAAPLRFVHQIRAAAQGAPR
jgi:hypothetical protein